MISDKIKLYIQNIMSASNLNCDTLSLTCKDDKLNGVIKGNITYKNGKVITMEPLEFGHITDPSLKLKLETPVLTSPDSKTIMCEPINNATSYTLRKIKDPFGSSPVISDIEYKYLEALLLNTNDGNTLYLVKANGDNELYSDSDFSNEYYRPGTPEVIGKITDEGIYNITVHRDTSYVLTYLAIYQSDYDAVNDSFEYRGPDMEVSKNMFVGIPGEYTFNVVELPINPYNTLATPTIELRITTEG